MRPKRMARMHKARIAPAWVCKQNLSRAPRPTGPGQSPGPRRPAMPGFAAARRLRHRSPLELNLRLKTDSRLACWRIGEILKVTHAEAMLPCLSDARYQLYRLRCPIDVVPCSDPRRGGPQEQDF